MSPRFAAAVDPVFEHVLGLLERIEAGSEPEPGTEQAGIVAALERAEAKLGHSPDWEQAKFALIAWIDEVLIDNPWDGRNWWTRECLEVKYYNERLANTQFYEEAKRASANGNRDALEVFYLAVVLGFRGFYHGNPSPQQCQALGLPASIGNWTRKTAASIQLGQGLPPVFNQPEEGLGAPPLYGRFELLGALLWFVVLSAVTAVLAWKMSETILPKIRDSLG
jgi:type VI secretion system protein ImpK